MTRRTDRSNGSRERPAHAERTPLELLALHRDARLARPPRPLVSYALGIHPIVSMHVALEEKQYFEAWRAELRRRAGYAITQPGAFAAWVAFVRRREAAAFDFALDLLAP